MSEDIDSLLVIRPEGPYDRAAIRVVNRLAFARPVEAAVVDVLREQDAVVLSMVAIEGKDIVGHALVTPVRVTTRDGEVEIVGLGPVAVVPSKQGKGVGTQLIETVLEKLRQHQHPGIVVAGDPSFYSRFGFISGKRWGLRWELEAPDEVFMAMELSPGGLAAVNGVVSYRPEFADTVPE